MLPQQVTDFVIGHFCTMSLRYQTIRLVFGTLYPAYASYKAVRTKNVKEYVKWMMYWIVFALFTCAETITDVFLSWFPFYYEIKIVLVLWLLSPATKGSSILYRKFVHPMLSQREQEIDDYIAKAKEQGYHTVLNLGSKGVTYATNVIMQTAIKGGGGIVNQLKKSYSLSDLSDDTTPRNVQSLDVVDQEPRRRTRRSPHRSQSERNSKVDMYFPEMDIRPDVDLSHVRSTDDISSGYSSAEPLYGQNLTQGVAKVEPREGLVRTSSVGGASRSRTRATTRATIAKKVSIPEDSEREYSSGSETETKKYCGNSKKIPNVIKNNQKDSPEDSDSSSENFVDTLDSFEQKNIPSFKKLDVVTQNVTNEKFPKTNEEKQETNLRDQQIAPKIENQCSKLLDNIKHLSETIQVEKFPENTTNLTPTSEEPKFPKENCNLTEELTKVIKTLEKDPKTDLDSKKFDNNEKTPLKDEEFDFWQNISGKNEDGNNKKVSMESEKLPVESKNPKKSFDPFRKTQDLAGKGFSGEGPIETPNVPLDSGISAVEPEIPKIPKSLDQLEKRSEESKILSENSLESQMTPKATSLLELPAKSLVESGVPGVPQGFQTSSEKPSGMPKTFGNQFSSKETTTSKEISPTSNDLKTSPETLKTEILALDAKKTPENLENGNIPSEVFQEEKLKEDESSEKKMLEAELDWVKEKIQNIEEGFQKTPTEEKDEFFEANLEDEENEENDDDTEFLESESQDLQLIQNVDTQTMETSGHLRNNPIEHSRNKVEDSRNQMDDLKKSSKLSEPNEETLPIGSDFQKFKDQKSDLGIKKSAFTVTQRPLDPIGTKLVIPQEPFQSKSVEDLSSRSFGQNLAQERPKSSLDYKVFDSLLHGEDSNSKKVQNESQPAKNEKSSGFFSSRGGKYNKLTAPEPPKNFFENPEPEIPENVSHPIKATLVLKPGVIKSVPLPTAENENKTIFMHKSPKNKRKRSSKSKNDSSPISKLMMLPKKLWGHKDIGESATKRNSLSDSETLDDLQRYSPNYFRRIKNDSEDSD